MFDTVFAHLITSGAAIRERPEGVAFFRAAKELYGFASISYLAFNIRVPSPNGFVLHCSYSETGVKHCAMSARIAANALARFGLAGVEPLEWPTLRALDNGAAVPQPSAHRSIVFPLAPRGTETAFLGVSAAMDHDDWDRHKAAGMRDVRVLGNYFHSHILRINGHDAERDMLVSARELDCLKWTAAGKTAWEASIILGISERTVRFHLNAAREKLNCATTTQAVAKAMRHQLIDVPDA